MTVTLKSAADLLSVIPGRLGFVPKESAVFVGAAKDGLLGLVARVNLAEVQEHLLGVLAEHMANSGATSTIVALYTDTPAAELADLSESIGLSLLARDIAVPDVLCVGPERWSSLICTHPGCDCGGPVSQVSGNPVVDAMFGQVKADRSQVLDLTPRGQALPQDAALVAVLTTPDSRDQWLGEVCGGEITGIFTGTMLPPANMAQVIEDLAALARRNPDAVDSIAAVIAMLAWWSGDGAKANLAVEHSSNALARLVNGALVAGLPPAWVKP